MQRRALDNPMDAMCLSCNGAGEAFCEGVCGQVTGDKAEQTAACMSGFDQLFEVDQGLDTDVEIRLGNPDDLNLPNWT